MFSLQAGQALTNMVDTTGGGWTVVLAGTIEMMLVFWVYVYRRFVGGLSMMLGGPPNAFFRFIGFPVNWFWTANWMAITPVMLMVCGRRGSWGANDDGDYVNMMMIR